jgi:DNA topoisomerase VI subunit A
MTSFLSPCDRLEILRRIECVCLELRSQAIKEQEEKQQQQQQQQEQQREQVKLTNQKNDSKVSVGVMNHARELRLEIEHPLTKHVRIISLRPRDSNSISIVHIVRTLHTIYEVVLRKSNTTLRALYYQNCDIFLTQTASNLSVSLCSQLLRVRRPLLSIWATGKGVVWGPIQLINSSNSTVIGNANTKRAPHGLRISDSLTFVRGLTFQPEGEIVKDNSAEIQFILVVEKESVFNRIVEEVHLRKTNSTLPTEPFVMVSGNGMPSLATRELVRLLHARLNVPVFGMFDCNPDGIGIALSYVYTSDTSIKSLGWVATRLDYTIRSINWLGIKFDDVLKEAKHRNDSSIDDIASGIHTQRDDSRFTNLLKHPLIKNNCEMISELKKMKGGNVKFEIDQLSYKSLIDFVEDGVKEDGYIVIK